MINRGDRTTPMKRATAKALTERQLRVLEFIVQALEGTGFPPTLREIGAHMKIRSTNGVNDHIRALERKGYLHRSDMKSRGICLTAKARTAFQMESDCELELIVIRNSDTGAFASELGFEWQSNPFCWPTIEAAQARIELVKGELLKTTGAPFAAPAREWLDVAEVRLLRARLVNATVSVDVPS